jgi:hypothetical protein
MGCKVDIESSQIRPVFEALAGLSKTESHLHHFGADSDFDVGLLDTLTLGFIIQSWNSFWGSFQMRANSADFFRTSCRKQFLTLEYSVDTYEKMECLQRASKIKLLAVLVDQDIER